MTVGRKPKPTALRVLNGNAGRRPLNEAEPVTAPLSADPPEWLGLGARRFWNEIYDIVKAMNVALESDKFALATLASLMAEIRDAHQSSDPKTLVSAVPQALRIMAEFGMTPASRTKVRQLAMKEDTGGLEGFLKRGQQSGG